MSFVTKETLEAVCFAYEQGYEIGLYPGEHRKTNKYQEGSAEHYAWEYGYLKSNCIIKSAITNTIQ